MNNQWTKRRGLRSLAGPWMLLFGYLLGCQASPAPPSWASEDFEGRFEQARELYLAGILEGNEPAAIQALTMLQELATTRDPPAPRTLAYLGSARLLEASRVLLPWEKGARASEGLELLDRAVEEAPDDVEIRFLRGASALPLPGFFERAESARADLEWSARRAPEALRTGRIDQVIYDGIFEKYHEIDPAAAARLDLNLSHQS